MTKPYKSHNSILFLYVLILLGLSMDLRADELEVEERLVLNVSSKAVWALVGSFNTLDRWHPDVSESTSIGTGKKVGDIRVLTLVNNKTIVERLDSYNEYAMTLQYKILDSPLPIVNYKASISVTNIGDNLAEVVWKSSFNAVDVSEDEAKNIIRGIYLSGLNSINRLFR